MPTADRRLFVPQAIRYFLRQDYPNCELIVVDDGADAVADLIPPDSRLRYVRLNRKQTIGAKRNLACEEARGEVIIHWDDDDWNAKWRLNYQVEGLLNAQADVSGLDKLFYYNLSSHQSWQYIYPPGSKPWVAGNTLCYTKPFWKKNPFPNINVGEDTKFLWSGHPKKIIALQDCKFYLALIHPGNASPKRTSDSRWHSHPLEEIRSLLGEDWAFYAGCLQNKTKGQTK
ncbi:MAG: glycosyltransferase family 2 protein [candidate division KSB1 bacterium]|nr:glycosyltransferase family 2 protein [candidate division KSB1 bacterium]MDZ7366249.1 glycosyltransferase family 2 protein [candidate division KSB1 bacterium]MDZ7404467.1 glycosyltransferase family 2 protein [candidate division KSB1 bacterium]